MTQLPRTYEELKEEIKGLKAEQRAKLIEEQNKVMTTIETSFTRQLDYDELSSPIHDSLGLVMKLYKSTWSITPELLRAFMQWKEQMDNGLQQELRKVYLINEHATNLNLETFSLNTEELIKRDKEFNSPIRKEQKPFYPVARETQAYLEQRNFWEAKIRQETLFG